MASSWFCILQTCLCQICLGLVTLFVYVVSVWIRLLWFVYNSFPQANVLRSLNCSTPHTHTHTQTSLRAVALCCNNTWTEYSKLTPVSSQMNVPYKLTVAVTMDTHTVTRMLTSSHRQGAGTIVPQTTWQCTPFFPDPQNYRVYSSWILLQSRLCLSLRLSLCPRDQLQTLELH